MVSTNVLVMSKKIKIQLSESSINDAIKQIEEYKRDLESKVQTFVTRLTEQGLSVTNTIIQAIPDETARDIYADVTPIQGSGNVYRATVYVSGTQVLFIEFSAGIMFGTNQFGVMPNNPSYGSGYGMGTYPGKGHWDDPRGWWFKDDSDEWVHTYGTKAHAPMYHADQEMRLVLTDVAKAVFGGK